MSIDLDAGAALELRVGREADRITAGLDGIRGVLGELGKEHAAPFATSDGAVGGVGAANAAVLDLGGPNIGRYWELTTLAVFGGDDRTVIAGTNVVLYITQTSAAPLALSLADVVLPGAANGVAVTVPFADQFGRRQIVALPPNRVIVVVYGVLANVPVNATARGWDRDIAELPNRG